MLALVIILLRAGLGLNKQQLKQVGIVSIKMSAIPCLVEGFIVMFAAIYLFNLPLLEAGMLAFIIAAVSPAVIVPSMLRLKEEGKGMDKGIPLIILAGASIDDIFAITLFSTFLNMALTPQTSITQNLIQIPIQILGGVTLGLFIGYILYKIFRYHKIRISMIEKLSLLLIFSFITLIVGELVHIAGLLSIMTIGFSLLENNMVLAKTFEQQLNKIWFFAQIFLFVLIGAAVDINVALEAGLIGFVLIGIAIVARILGVFIALFKSNLNMKERLFCAIAYIPKATVQAAIGGIPLASGIASGNLILALAVLSVIITAPLGAIGINSLSGKLLNNKNRTKDHYIH
jgi:solute carrier family 9B (sodium/hydrogen exchanger), member 1/2